MRKLRVYNQISLDGFFTDSASDMSWAHKQDPEWNEYVAGNARGEGALVFGRVTYQQMASFWPSVAALQAMPVVAEQMNRKQKIVFSRTLKEASWNNTLLLHGDLANRVRELKTQEGPDMVIFGSGTLVAQLAANHLIDEYTFVLNPIVLGAGRTLFDGMKERVCLSLKGSRTFKNGNVVLTYE